MTAENPNWRSMSCDPASVGIEDLTEDQVIVRRIAK
jgi:hypothetical protein